MASLLTIPWELRDEIWRLSILSPTGCLSILDRNTAFCYRIPTSTSSSGPHFYLLATDSQNKDEEAAPLPTSDRISLSLPRTCRQIYGETNHIFWKSNIFTFLSPYYLIRTFKQIGPIPSRCISSLRLDIGAIEGNVLELLAKAMNLLTKRETGALRRVDLVLNMAQLLQINEYKPGGDAIAMPGPMRLSAGFWYDDLLEVLGRGQEAKTAFERTMTVIPFPREVYEFTNEQIWKRWVEGLELVLFDIHKAWNGDLFLRDELLLSNLEMVDGGLEGVMRKYIVSPAERAVTRA